MDQDKNKDLSIKQEDVSTIRLLRDYMVKSNVPPMDLRLTRSAELIEKLQELIERNKNMQKSVDNMLKDHPFLFQKEEPTEKPSCKCEPELNGIEKYFVEDIYKGIKPPLGVEPREFRDEQRLRELQGAIARYYDADLPIRVEWVEEYNELIKKGE